MTVYTLDRPVSTSPDRRVPAASLPADTRTLAKFLAISAAAAIALFTLLSLNLDTSTPNGARCTFIGGSSYPVVIQHDSSRIGGRTHPYTAPAAKPTSMAGYGSCSSSME